MHPSGMLKRRQGNSSPCAISMQRPVCGWDVFTVFCCLCLRQARLAGLAAELQSSKTEASGSEALKLPASDPSYALVHR